MRPADLPTRDSAHAQWLRDHGHVSPELLAELLADVAAAELEAKGGLAAWLVGCRAISEAVAAQIPTQTQTASGEVTIRDARWPAPAPLTDTAMVLPADATTDVPRRGAQAILKAAPADPNVRTIGKYLIDDVLGKGGMGVVYKAYDPDLERTVALKVLGLAERQDHEAIERFFREARTAGALRHPGIIAVHEVGQCEDIPFVAMEYIDGQPLWQWIHDRDFEAWPIRDRLALFLEISRAVQHAHDHGIVHRDLKTSNVMIDSRGRPVVLDFGLARQIDGSSRITVTGAFLGTPGYMPPEQLDGESKAIGTHTDVFALGVILYELLTTKMPFQGDSPASTIARTLSGRYTAPRTLNPRVHPDLETICVKSLELEIPRRYPNAGALADDLQRFLGNEPILARPIGRVRRAGMWLQRHRGAAVAGACAAAVLLALLGVGIWAWTRPAWLRLRVKPADATVTVSGIPVAAAGEVRTVEVPPGTHSVRVERAGHVPAVQEERDLARNETREVVVDLERETGTLVVDAWPPQGVEVDHAGGVIPYMNLKTRKIELRLPTGRHQVSVGREGHYRERIAVDVAKDVAVERRVTFRKAVLWKHTSLDWGMQHPAGDLDGDGIPDFLSRSFFNVVAMSGRTGKPFLQEQVESPAFSFARPIDVDGDGAREWVTCRVGTQRTPELVALSALRTERLKPLWSAPADGVLTLRRFRELRGGQPRFAWCGDAVAETGPDPGKPPEDDLSRGAGPYADLFLVRSEGDLDGDGVADLLTLCEGPELRAHSGRNGARLWSRTLPAPAWRIVPLDRDSTLAHLLMVADGRAWALDARTGALAWEISFDEPPWLGPSPTAQGLVAGIGSTLRTLDPATGRETRRAEWQPLPAPDRPVHLRGGRLLQAAAPSGEAAAPTVGAWSLADGTRTWSRAVDLDPAQAFPMDTNADGRVELVGRSADGARLIALDEETGESRWSFAPATPLTFWIQLCDLAPDRKLAILAAAGATVFLLDPASGQPLWTIELPAPVSCHHVGGDYDADGRTEILFGTEAGHLVALAADGREIFSAHVGQPVRSITMTHADWDGMRDFLLWLPDGAVAVRAPKLLWRRKVDRQVRAQPALHDVNGDGVPDAILPLLDTGNEWPVTALDGRDGSTLWEERHSLDMARPVAVADLDGDGRAEVVTWHKDAHALRLLDAGTGKPVGDVEMPAFGYAEPTLADLDGDGAPDVVALGWYEGAAYAAMSGKTRAILWRGRSEVPAWSGASFGDADGDGSPEVFFVTRAGVVFALHGRTGVPVWRQQVGDGRTPTSAAVGLVRFAAAEPLVAVVSGGDRRLYYFEAASGRLEQTVADAGGTASRPVFADVNGDGVPEVIVGSLDGMVCVDRRGERIWFVRAGTVTGDPVIADLEGDGRAEVVFGNVGGMVFCVEAASGSLRWAWSAAPDDEPATADPAAQLRDQIEGTVGVADFDRDGVLDVIVPSHNGTISCVSGRGRMKD